MKNMGHPLNRKRALSPTQINSYMDCSAKYMFRYVEGLKVPPGIALTVGSSVDKGCEANFREKAKTGNDLPVDSVADAVATYFDREIKNTDLKEGDNATEEREMAIGLVKKYREDVMPSIQPKPDGIQEMITIPLEDFPVDFTTKMDVATIQDQVIDQKTASKSPNGVKEAEASGKPLILNDWQHRFQVGSYALAHQYKWGKPTTELIVDYMVKNKTPKVVRAFVTFDDEDKRLWLNMVSRVWHGISNEVFMPNRNSFMCSKKFCGFHQICSKRYGGVVKD